MKHLKVSVLEQTGEEGKGKTEIGATEATWTSLKDLVAGEESGYRIHTLQP